MFTELSCACGSARRLARTLTRLYDRRLRLADITAPQLAILAALQRGAASQVALGRVHALDKTTVSRNLRVLIRKGWVAFVVSEDRRERQVALTPAGQARLTRAGAEWHKAQAELQSTMTGAQWRAMFATFRAVATAAEELRRSPSRRSHRQ
ncbi:MAG TPA: MarR family winged helix-turn-helix transcriptional regulator [Vicinamibacterales bacterium]|nr:MarR family winged helix-turn-helix transcriptional regulator [Vicinamibacterales bacterium]HQZ38537.1 MarR family winged helix-turn-helix transcriptional regulator [Vicinamibacterales bacterium]